MKIAISRNPALTSFETLSKKNSFIRKRPDCQFFGNNSSEEVFGKLYNHMILILAKNEEFNWAVNRTFNNIDDLNVLQKIKDSIWEGENSFICNLKEKGASRFTIQSKKFSKNDSMASHTIGLVYDKRFNSLLVLDSLSDVYPDVRMYKNLLKYFLFANNSNKNSFSSIIFSTKSQQLITEYTCNNWAIANIEAVLKALNSGVIIKNSNDLNKILPNDINKVLEAQENYVLQHKAKFEYLCNG